jgi:DNA-directed RNA polymerase subunit H (RpoH/RPB5)
MTDAAAAVASSQQAAAPPPALPPAYHRHAKVVSLMLASRAYTVERDDAFEQAVAHGHIDGTGPRFGKFRVVFFNLDRQRGGGGGETSGGGGGGGGGSIGVDEIDTLLETTRDAGIQHVILIVDCEITYVARGELIDSGLHWEMFLYEDVSIDRIHHMWMPTYRRMHHDEVRRVFSTLCGKKGRVSQNFDNPCTDTSCFCPARLLTNNQVSRYYDFQHGDMIHVSVDSSTAGRVEKYHVVMSNTSMQ